MEWSLLKAAEHSDGLTDEQLDSSTDESSSGFTYVLPDSLADTSILTASPTSGSATPPTSRLTA